MYFYLNFFLTSNYISLCVGFSKVKFTYLSVMSPIVMAHG